jgi:hypothetical protein
MEPEIAPYFHGISVLAIWPGILSSRFIDDCNALVTTA